MKRKKRKKIKIDIKFELLGLYRAISYLFFMFYAAFFMGAIILLVSDAPSLHYAYEITQEYYNFFIKEHIYTYLIGLLIALSYLVIYHNIFKKIYLLFVKLSSYIFPKK